MFQKIFHDSFVRQNAVFFVGSLLVAVLNYIYHPVMSRMMSVEQFGEVQAYISLTYITGIFLIVFRTVVINLVADRGEQGREIARHLQRIVFWGMCAFAVILLLIGPLLADSLKFQSFWPLVPLAAMLIIGVPLGYAGALLQGSKDFVSTSIINIIMAGGKLLLAILFVVIMPQVFGAVLSIACASFLALVYGTYKARLQLKALFDFSTYTQFSLKKEFSYGGLVFCGLGFVTFLYTSDVLFVKYFFSPEEAGLYSGVATIARIIFFATASVAAVLLPSIKTTASPLENRKILRKALIIIGLMGTFALGLFSLFPLFFTTILIGQSYAGLAPLLPFVGLYVFLASFVNLFFAYLLALRDRFVMFVALVSLVVLFGLLGIFHGSFTHIVLDYIVTSVFALGLIIYRMSGVKSIKLKVERERSKV